MTVPTPDAPSGGVVVERSRGSAHDFHHRPPTLADDRAAIWIHEVTAPAIVLGSSQRSDVVDRERAEAAGWEVTGRRSGGGIVVVEPGESAWVDVVVPRRHRRWDDDVHRAFGWVGEWWAAALSSLGVAGLEVHHGGLVGREHGRVVCFAGVGPGEVVRRDDADGPSWKIVGLSQRRTRDVARFQGLYLRRWNPGAVARFVRPDALPADLVLDDVRAGLTDGPDPARVVDALVGLATDVVG